MRPRPLLIATLVGTILSGGQAASAMDVTACGQTVPEHDTGTLQTDLDCSSSPGICFYYIVDQPEADVACTSDAECDDYQGGHQGGRCSHVGVTLRSGATLAMNGHTLTGAGVLCDNRSPCAVVGTGEIVGAQGFGIYARGPLAVSDVAVHDGDYIGIMSLRSTMRLTNVDASRSTFSFGIDNVHGNVLVENVTANDNSNNGVNAGGSVRGTGLTATGNLVGVTAKRIAVRGLQAIDNQDYGIISGKISLRDSTLTGNGAGSDDPFDIYLIDFGYRHPTIHVVRTTCGISNAGVCTND